MSQSRTESGPKGSLRRAAAAHKGATARKEPLAAGRFEWRGRLGKVAKPLSAAPPDVVVLLAIAAVAGALEFGLTLAYPAALAWELLGSKLTLREALHNGDLFTLLIFLVIGSLRVLKWASPSSFGSRIGRSAALYTTAWICGALVVSALHVAVVKDKQRPAARHTKPPAIAFERPWAERQKDGTVWIRLTREIDLFFKQKEGTMVYALDMNDRDIYINDCWKTFARTTSDICVQDRLLDVIAKAKKGDSFDWAFAQEQFGKSLLAALVDALTADVALDAKSDDYNSKVPLRYLEKESTYVTALGTLHQFGWNRLKHALLRSEAMIDMPDPPETDIDEAIDHYEQAASENDPSAQILMGFAYLIGVGVPQSATQASLYFAAAQHAVPAAAILQKLAQAKLAPEVSPPH
jgi:hypothetical protein